MGLDDPSPNYKLGQVPSLADQFMKGDVPERTETFESTEPSSHWNDADYAAKYVFCCSKGY